MNVTNENVLFQWQFYILEFLLFFMLDYNLCLPSYFVIITPDTCQELSDSYTIHIRISVVGQDTVSVYFSCADVTIVPQTNTTNKSIVILYAHWYN